MVVIETASNGAEDETAKNHVNSTGLASEATTGAAEVEGYETATDGEGDDGESISDENTVAAKDPYEDALNDEQLQQRALTKANEAKAEGNKLFVSGQYEDALLQYELALQVVSELPSTTEVRSICHANRAACFSKLGNFENTIKECTKALELNPSYMKALVRRGEAHEKLEHYEEAVTDMKKIVELDPSDVQARRALLRLEPLAAEKREKMKEEMIGKLKDMGNSVLGRFGMSVDNFKAVKDPNTGSYSISFQR